MSARRDDIPAAVRLQIAEAMLAPHRVRGEASQLAREHGVSRPTVYAISARARALLLNGLAPGRHGPQPTERVIRVDRNRLLRSTLALTEVGVSQRDILGCLDEMLDTTVSPGWVNGQLAELENQAEQVNQSWRPAVGEGLAGDELFANGQPHLLVVGNDSLYVYALTRQPQRDGDTRGCIMLELPPGPQFASDGGTGLAAGLAEAGLDNQQLDWDHLSNLHSPISYLPTPGVHHETRHHRQRRRGQDHYRRPAGPPLRPAGAPGARH